MQNPTLRIAMWSAPRNISTAMLRAWDNRGDTAVLDEPPHCHYLKNTGRRHPGAQAVIANPESDLTKVIPFLLGPIPGGKPIFYQKHMTHHPLPGMDRQWLRQLSTCFLIREPREVITSLIK